MQTRSFPSTPDARSPAGAEIRYLMGGETGNMIHSTEECPPEWWDLSEAPDLR